MYTTRRFLEIGIQQPRLCRCVLVLLRSVFWLFCFFTGALFRSFCFTATALSIDLTLRPVRTQRESRRISCLLLNLSPIAGQLRANQIAALLEELSMDEELRTELGIVAEIDGADSSTPVAEEAGEGDGEG